MDVRMLGPLEIIVGGEAVSVGGPRMRRLLGSLALGNGSVRSTDSLIEAVWADEQPPDGARRTVMSYISRLRTALGDDVVEQIEHGYRLDQSSISTDIDAFEHLVVEGQRMFKAGNHPHAVALLDEALALWRGEPLAEFAGEMWAEPDRTGLMLLRLSAIEDRYAAKIDLGDHNEVVVDLGADANRHPERERLQYLHMLALYRAGQQTAALARYESARHELAEMGLEPSPDLRALELRILTHEEPLHEPGPRPGSDVRGFRLGERLGEGAFGSIYVATQPTVGREVAVKVIRPELANDPRFVRRFETEAQLVARLEHPHIVPLYDYWREPGGAYLVMRLLRGGSAEQQLITDGPMPLDDVAQVVDEIGSALAAAHARGVIHRDVKPANILFDDDGVSYLADFGIACEGDEHTTDGLRSARSRMYASPEQMQGSETSIRSDVYSFGVTIYELLAGRTAFSGGSVDGLPRRTPSTAVPPIAPERPDIPPQIDLVLARATDVDPMRRFGGVSDLVLAFRTALAVASNATHVGDHVRPTPVSPRTATTATLLNAPSASVNPYKGLRAFLEADAQDFFGRERLVGELVDRVRSRRLVAVVGASGSGKSSLVRAGLVPAVADRDWFVTTIVPGSHPLEELEGGLLRIATDEVPGLHGQLIGTDRGLVRAVRRVLPPDSSELLLVIDQFEEVFTLATSDERDRFLAGLVQAITDDRSRIRIVVTVRADFFDRPLRDRAFGELLQDATVNVLPLSRDDLTAAIEGPAVRLGARFEPGLVEAIAADVGESAGVLPLLQYALTELYDHSDADVMTFAGYREIGGVTGALAKRAEEVYNGLSVDDREGARRLFTRLVTPGEGVDDTRRRALRSELTICGDDVIDAFGERRLLSFDCDPATRAPTVEVAHEALIREWLRLRQWLDDDRDGLRILRHLTDAARGWVDADCDGSELYRGGRLDAALEWAAGRQLDLADDEDEFLSASRRLRDAEQAEAAERADQRDRQHRRLRRSLVGLAIVTVVALVSMVVALQQRSSARDQADAAAAARVAAETRRLISDVPQLAPTNRRVALLLAAEAFRRQPGPDSLGALKDALASAQNVIGYVGADIAFNDIAWTSDGRIIGTHEAGVVVLGLDGRREREIERVGATALAVRSDDVVAVAGTDQTVRVFDLANSGQIADLDHGATLNTLDFSDDGRWLATGDRRGVVRLFDERFDEVAAFDAFVDADPLDERDDVAPPLAHEPLTFREGAVDVALSADGRYLAAVGGADFVVWSTSDFTELAGGPVTRDDDDDGVRSATPTGVGFVVVDGSELLAVAEVTSTMIASPTSGELLDRWKFSGGVPSNIAVAASSAFTDDLALTVGGDGRLRVASSDPADADVIDAQFGAGLAVAADPSGVRVAVAGGQGALVVSLAGKGLISRSIVERDNQEFFVSSDGATVVATDVGLAGSRTWRFDGDQYHSSPIPPPVESFSWTGLPFGLTWHEPTGTSQLRDPLTMEPFGPTYGTHGVVGADLSADGRWLAMGDSRRTSPTRDLTVWVHDTSTGDIVAALDDFANDESALVRNSIFSPDDRHLLVITDDGRAVVYDTDSWTPVEPLLSAGGGAVVEGAYNEDGSVLATVARDGSITFRDPHTFQPDGLPLLGNTDAVEGFSLGPFFSEGGRWMLTLSDGELRMFDVEQRALVGGPFPREGAGLGAVGSKAKFAVTPSEDGAIVWDLDVDRWPEIACEAAGRNMTPAEWEQFGPADEPYRATCDQWPSLAEETSNTGGES